MGSYELIFIFCCVLYLMSIGFAIYTGYKLGKFEDMLIEHDVKLQTINTRLNRKEVKRD